MRLAAALSVIFVSSLPAENAELAIVTQFEQRPSSQSMEVMRAQVANLLRSANVTLRWLEQPPDAAGFAAVIRVRFLGLCSSADLRSPNPAEMDPFGGPVRLAAAKLMHAAVLPAADVECDAIRTALRRVPFRVRAKEFGNMLGRVLAHELYHILAKTTEHTISGLSKAVLEWEELARDDLVLSEPTMRQIWNALQRPNGREH